MAEMEPLKPDYSSYTVTEAAMSVAEAASRAAACFSTTWVGEIDPNGAETVRDGTILSSFMNLSASALGASMLSLPYAMMLGGPIGTIALYCAFAYMAYLSAQAVVAAGIRSGQSTYVGIVGDIYGPGAGIFAECLLSTALLIAGVSFICGLEDLCTKMVPFTANIDRSVRIIFLMITMFPSTLVRSLAVFSMASIAAIIGCYAMAGAMMSEVWSLSMNDETWTLPALSSLFSFSISGLVYVSPMVCFVFAFHYLLTETLDELAGPTEENMTLINRYSVQVLFILYLPLAIGGYLVYSGVNIPANMLADMNPKSGAVQLCQFVMAALLWGTYALFIIPLRRRVEYLAFGETSDGNLAPSCLTVAIGLNFVVLVISVGLPDLSIANSIAGGCIALVMFGFPGLMMLDGEVGKHADPELGPNGKNIWTGRLFVVTGVFVAFIGLFGSSLFPQYS